MDRPLVLLIVDDDQDLVEEVEAAGFTARRVRDPAEVPPAVASATLAFVVMDYDLPGGVGPALVQRLQAMRVPGLRIVALTEVQTAKALLRVFRMGAADAILKPTSGTEIALVLQRLRGSEPDARSPEPAPLVPLRPPSRLNLRVRPKWASPTMDDAPLPILHPRMEEVRAVLVNLETKADAIVQIAESDPTLASRVLRAANSGFFRGTRTYTNLRDACVRLGNRQGAGVLLEAILGEAFRSPDPRFGTLLGVHWGTAVLTARVARWISHSMGARQVEEYYVAALLHNIGEMVMLWRLAASRAGETGSIAVEEAGYWIDEAHEAVGAAYATKQRLPPLVGILAGNHHSARSGEGVYDRGLRVLILGSWCLARQVVGDGVPTRFPLDPEPYLAELRLTPERRDALDRLLLEWRKGEG